MISFVIPCHNYGRFLNKCLSSILNNNSKYIREIIIVNDSSSDNTDQIVKYFKLKSKKIFYFKKKFRNLAKTMNFAIKKTKGEILCKVDPDDYIKKNFSKLLYKNFIDNNYDFLYSDIIVKNILTKKNFYLKQKINPLFKMIHYPLGSGCLFKKKIWKIVKGYNENNYYQDDYDFWLKIKKNDKFNIGYYSKGLYVYNKHNLNMSKNFLKKYFTKLKIFLSHI